MNAGDIKEALTHKYGPLPGYAWAGIGAAAIVLVASRRSSSSAGTGPSFLTTPPAGAIAGGDFAGAGGGAGGVDPGVDGGSDGVPSVTPGDGSTAGGSAGGDAAGTTTLAATYAMPTAADYFAANPLPQGTSTADALGALGQFDPTDYTFGAAPGVDYSTPDTAAGWAAIAPPNNVGSTSPQNAAEPVAVALAAPAIDSPAALPVGSTSNAAIYRQLGHKLELDG